MKTTKKAVLTLIGSTLLFSLNALGGAGSSGGGDIDELREYHTLPEKRLEQSLTISSHHIKKIASDLVQFIDPETINSDHWPHVSKLFTEITKVGIKEVSNRILTSNFFMPNNFEEYCPEFSHKSACTLNYIPGATVLFNKNRLHNRGTSYAELVGVIMHEVSHWYLGDLDDSSFEIGAFFEKAFIQNKHKGRVFTKRPGELLHEVANRSFPFLASVEDALQVKTYANEFCRAKEYSTSRSFEVQSESFLEKTRFYYYGNGRLSYSTLKEGLVFTSITCI